MANLAASAVVVNGWYYGNARTGSKTKVVDATLTLTGQGGVTNQILATLFGLRVIDSVPCFVDSNNNAYLASPDTTKLFIMVSSKAPPSLSQAFYQATGLASTGDITVAGITTAETLIAVQDLTTPAELGTTNFVIKAGGGKITQASGAGDLHLKTLRFQTQTLTTPSAVATDLTATVRCIVVGRE